jgi:ligand-binding sensor domain-containing protein/signal transduction histidine kinase
MLSKNKTDKIFVIIILLLSLNLISAGQRIQFNNLTTNDGLSSSNILCIQQDKNGFVWIGTYDGLNRYDSKEFKIYKHETNNPNSLPDNLIRSLFIDSENNMYVGTNTGISKYNINTDKFLNYCGDTTSCLFNFSFQANDVEIDKEGKLWIATNIGLVLFDEGNNEYELFTHNNENKGSLSNSHCTSVHADKQGQIWVSTQSGLHVFDDKNKTFRLIDKGINGENFSAYLFLKIVQDKYGTIWVNSEDGLFRINLLNNEEKLEHFSNDPENPKSISKNMLASNWIDKENRLWIGAENNGLYRYDSENRNFSHIRSGSSNIKLTDLSINAIFEDNAENMWLGTYGHGVLIVPKNSYAISLFENFNVEGINYNNNLVNTFLEDKKGQIWIGTDGKGIFLLDKKTEQFKNYNTHNSGLSNDYILSLIEDENQIIWMATWDGGLIRFNPRNKTFTSFTTQNSNIPDDKIYSMALGKNNELWMGSHYGGLIHFNQNSNKFTSINELNANIGDNTVNVIKNDDVGNLFIGTTRGLVKYDTSTKQLKKIVINNKNDNSILDAEINDIVIETDTSVWFGTLLGLGHLNPKSGKLIKYTTEDGLPGNTINGLIKDNTGNLWVSTTSGICRFDSSNGSFRVFTKDDGLQSNEFRPRSINIDKAGKLYFGGVNGFNIIDPEKITANKILPEVRITGMDIFHIPVTPTSPDSPLKKNITETKKVELKYNQSVLTFHFAVLDFTSPNKNQYAYKIDEIDNDWVYCGNSCEATYTNLDPGEYVFHVKGANNDGVWNELGASIIISVTPPWHKTWWFKSLLIFTFALIVLAIFYIRISVLKRQKLILEDKVERRTKELAKIIATKDKLFSIIAHDLRNPFNAILGFTDLLLDDYKDYDEKTLNKILINLKESGENAFTLLTNLLEWSGIQKGTIDFLPIETTASEVILKSIIEINSQCKKKEITIIDETEGKYIPLFVDINMLLLVLRNLLTNAIKFSNSGTRVIIDILQGEGEFVTFRIEDQGVGIDSEKAKTLFSFGENNPSVGTKGEKGTGLGLILCKEFVKRHGGNIWVESVPGKGSVFCFTVPKSKQSTNAK